MFLNWTVVLGSYLPSLSHWLLTNQCAEEPRPDRYQDKQGDQLQKFIIFLVETQTNYCLCFMWDDTVWFSIIQNTVLNATWSKSYPCSTLVLGLWPETDSELSASEGTTAKNLQGINNRMKYEKIYDIKLNINQCNLIKMATLVL